MGRPPRELLREIGREITGLIRCDQIGLAFLSEDEKRFQVLAVRPEREGSPTRDFPRDGSCAGQALKRGRAEIVPDLKASRRTPEVEALLGDGIRCAAFLPLAAGLRQTVLIVGSKEPGGLDRMGLGILERARGLIALAFAAAEAGRARASWAGAMEASPELLALNRVSARIAQEDDLQILCRMFLDAVREHSGYRRAVLSLVDEQGRDYQWFFTGLTDAEIDRFHADKMTPPQRASVLQDRYRIGNSYRVPASVRFEIGGLCPRSGSGAGRGGDLLVIPLYGPGASLVGMLMLDEARGAGAPNTEALLALEMSTNQVGQAVEKKRLEQAVRSAQSRLRSAQEQLMQAEKLSAIGQLISGVAHELNNPLSGVMGFSQLLMANEINPKVKKNLERIYSEAIRCQKIVQNLLMFARRHQPEKTCQNLNEVIDSVLELRAYQLQVDNIEVERRYDAQLPQTMLDFHQMQQVVLNVVNNAHHAMMTTSGRPRRLIVTTERAGETIRARFTDTGTGIPRDRLEKIFEPFFTTKEAGKGTGLGLSLSRSIVKDHQGSMGAESVLGEGTIIILEMPLIKGEKSATPLPRVEKGSAAPTKPLRLLVVDDEEVLTELLQSFLETVGHAVDQARDGRVALRMALASDYDAILTDLKMPSLDGEGFYQELCRVKPQMRGRFIFSTGDLANPRVQTFFQTSGCLYLSKPFKLETVLAVLEQLVIRQRAA